MKIKRVETKAVLTIVELENLKERQKSLYKKLEEMMPTLKKNKKLLNRVEIVDNFKKSNTAFTTTSVKRYSLKLKRAKANE